MMLLKGLTLIFAVVIVGVAILGHVNIPEGIEDPLRVQAIWGYWQLHMYVGKFQQWLSGETPTLASLQEKIVTEGTPASAAYGDMEVDLLVKRGKFADIPVIIYRPSTVTSNLSPAIIFIHGGGWYSGTADLYDKTVYYIAKNIGVVMFSIDYRRAPQHPFPAAVQDCLDATQHILRHGKEYGVDVTKVGIMGAGAGGNLAAAVALLLSKQRADHPKPIFQILHYPSLQALDLRLPAFVDHNLTSPILTARHVAKALALYAGLDEEKLEHYTTVLSENRHISPELKKSKYADYVNVRLLPKEFQTPNKTAPEVTDPYDSEVFEKIKQTIINPAFSPLMALDLTGVPPAFIHVCEFDVVRDDGYLYAERLRQAGVHVKVHFGRGGFHRDIERTFPDFLYPRSGQVAFEAACDFAKRMLEM